MKATVVNNVENTSRVIELPDYINNVASLKTNLDVVDGRIFEGVTHTDLDDDTMPLPQLPENKKERGYVFFVSPAQNKTKNGVYSRAECYNLIKENNLADGIKQRFARNFTQVKTDALNNFIEEKLSSSNNAQATPVAQHPAVNASSSQESFTEKDLWKAFIDEVCPVDKVRKFNDIVEKVFPNPYSVQDLANMRK